MLSIFEKQATMSQTCFFIISGRFIYARSLANTALRFFHLCEWVWYGNQCLHEQNLEAFVEVKRTPPVRCVCENNSFSKGSLGDDGPKRGHCCRRPPKANPLWPGMGPLKPSTFSLHLALAHLHPFCEPFKPCMGAQAR